MSGHEIAWRKGGRTMTREEYDRQEVRHKPEPGRKTRSTETPVIVTDWRERAKCRIEKTPTAYFFPVEGDQYARIRIPAFCRRCEVAEECGAWAIKEGIPWGWFGGLSPQQRSHRSLDDVDTNRPPRPHGFQRYRFGAWGKNPKNGCRCDTCTKAARERWDAEPARPKRRKYGA